MTDGVAEPLRDRATAPSTAEADYDRFVRDNLARNYTGNFLHGMLGLTGFRLVNAPTFVPAFIHSLSGSDAIVGLASGLQQLGGIISPIVGASRMEHLKRILPVSVKLGWAMRLQILGLALAGWFLSGAPALVLAMIFLFLLGVFQGPQRVAFQYLMAKVIPVRLRGRLQAWRNLTGGMIAAALSFMAGDWLVAHDVLGNGYATTFFLSFVLTSLGLSALRLLLREPDAVSMRARTGLRERLRDVPALVRDDRGFMWFMAARTLAMGFRIGQPFFFIHAAKVMGVSEAGDPHGFGRILAALSFAYMAADSVSNIAWGYLSDRTGYRSTFVWSMALYIAAIALLMAAHGWAGFVAAFFLVGAAQSAYLMSSTNIVLEFGHSHDVPMRMALSNTAEGAMGAVAPLIGGVLAATLGYAAAFGASLVTMAAALCLLIWKVDEPRRRASA